MALPLSPGASGLLGFVVGLAVGFVVGVGAVLAWAGEPRP